MRRLKELHNVELHAFIFYEILLNSSNEEGRDDQDVKARHFNRTSSREAINFGTYL
jgi:hypothetical protein